jgi:hypothetical protein
MRVTGSPRSEPLCVSECPHQDFVSDYGQAAAFMWPVNDAKKSSPNINLKN